MSMAIDNEHLKSVLKEANRQIEILLLEKRIGREVIKTLTDKIESLEKELRYSGEKVNKHEAKFEGRP